MRPGGCIVALVLLAQACNAVSESDGIPAIEPDYVGVTVPEGLAPLHFALEDGTPCKYEVSRDADTLWYTVTAAGVRYKPFPVYVSHDEIDRYLVYRLIEPGYESWNGIGICSRDLSSYDEQLLVGSDELGGGCVNCHSFPGGDGSTMLLHVRREGGGTLVSGPSGLRLLPIKATYPACHPAGRYVAFSVNTTNQKFTTGGPQPIEVYDTASDLSLLDLQTDSLISIPAATGPDALETFPCWSDDGTKLYYCSAPAVEDPARQTADLHYKIMSLTFKDGVFADVPEVVWENPLASASFPRVRGNFLMFTRSDCGTFPIWHHEADLWMLDLDAGTVREVSELNSSDTESYHSWSSNGSWVVLSTRRADGRYTRLMIAHHRGDGTFDKPFALPWKSADFDQLRMKSYNVPEFVKGEPRACGDAAAKIFGL